MTNHKIKGAHEALDRIMSIVDDDKACGLGEYSKYVCPKPILKEDIRLIESVMPSPSKFCMVVRAGDESDGVKYVVNFPDYPGVIGGDDDMVAAIREALVALEVLQAYLKEKEMSNQGGRNE